MAIPGMWSSRQREELAEAQVVQGARDEARPGIAWRAAAPPETAPPETEVVEEEETATRLGSPWRVILYNDEIHTFDEVIFQLIKATGCTVERAEALAWQVHTQGKANVFEGTFEECFRVQGVLREIQLVTEIEG